MFDLTLAVAHHLAVFALAGVLAAELAALRPGMDGVAARRLSSLDAGYGALAVAILAIGFLRAVYAEKGWDTYGANLFFWVKIGTFGVIGLLSIAPTRAFARWKKTGEGPEPAEIERLRRILWLEIALFALLPVFAAAMARGYGS
ncbi:DUF2214 family protein [Aurantimonas sp. Leaf443]|uniref:DUF2214 family protein n=1 Tax=Aurantimonas sp. Leaf443 TaxID=1736378 RepID=UPI0006F93109|nr:DUF2214 family protein [Aurantimonas sp. Leaf443]KQT86214.1 hypothetical protein ASG48_06505 [Aurantimonas sp. Leaf443]